MKQALLLEEDIRNVLNLSGQFSADYSISALQGGAVNNSYQLLDKSERYFVKVFCREFDFQLNRVEQYHRQVELAKLGLAPKPVYLPSNHSLQVDCWTEGQSLKDASLSPQQRYTQLANRMAVIHQLPEIHAFSLTELDLPNELAKYHQLIELDGSVQIDLSNTQAAIQRVGDVWYSAMEDDSCICHNDLSLQHVLCEPSSIVFDWEYAAQSSPYFDIAASLLINSALEEDESILLRGYAEASGKALSDIKNKVAIMKPIAKLTNELWFATAQLSKQ